MKIDYQFLPSRDFRETPVGTIEGLKDHALALVLIASPSKALEIQKELLEVVAVIENALFTIRKDLNG